MPPLPARQASGFLDAGAIRAAAEGQGLRLPAAAYASVAAALASGRHVVLTGAAGSGKTMLALAVARAAVTSGRSTGAVLITPAGRWSSGDALGRRAHPGGAPATTGQVPDAAGRGKWLVIDELDRADADKALGGLSTFLGGLPLTLPGGDEVKPPADWRVVATAGGPLEASPALLRRFAHVEVPFPGQSDIDALIEHASGGDPDRRGRRPPAARPARAAAARRGRLPRRRPPRCRAQRDRAEPTSARSRARRTRRTSNRCWAASTTAVRTG